jgi:predicted Mrr-cat superfamily restriction endonuclease
MKTDSIAVRELNEMFKEHKGNFTAVCTALDLEIDNSNDGRTADQDAAWERFGVEPKAVRRCVKEKDDEPKQKVLSELIVEQEEDAKTDLVVEDEEKLEAEAGLENEFSEEDFDRPEELEEEENHV